tara:strand:- start:157 stop:657 length:501 start_codon:yes stop_codon:yes gene_type:complete
MIIINFKIEGFGFKTILVMPVFRRLNKLKEDHGQSGDLTDYFNIKTNNINNKLKLMVIIPTMNEGIINIKIRYSIPQLLFEFQNLPLELNELIHSLIDYQLIVQVQMSLPKEYPFRPDYFRLVGMKNTIEHSKTKVFISFSKIKLKYIMKSPTKTGRQLWVYKKQF